VWRRENRHDNENDDVVERTVKVEADGVVKKTLKTKKMKAEMKI
jgi:hypothetical protein